MDKKKLNYEKNGKKFRNLISKPNKARCFAFSELLLLCINLKKLGTNHIKRNFIIAFKVSLFIYLISNNHFIFIAIVSTK